MSAPPVPEAFPLDHLAIRGARDATALVMKDRRLSFAELDEAVGKLATLLRRYGERGNRIASWAAKGWATCLLPLACARAGFVHVPINPLLKRAQAAHILADSGSILLIGTKSRLDTLEETDCPPRFSLLAEDQLEPLCEPLVAMPRSENDPGSLVAILYTSGSTGHPKGVMLSHANLWLGARSVAQYLALRPEDVTLAVLPLSFDYGQNQLLSAWYAGSTAVPLDYLFPRDVANACARYDVTTLAAVPPLWHQLVEHDWAGRKASLKRLTNSGGALTPDLIDQMQRLFPQADLYPMYGLTEAFRSTYLDPSLVAYHPTSIGTAIPFAEVLVVREDGSLCDAGEEGELVHCGPLVAQGYWQDAKKTAYRFRAAPLASRYGGTAVWSGDRVVRNAEGLLFFVGRRDAMIKSAGNRISPQEIEDAARSTGLVKDAVAIGVPDARAGQAVHLIVRGDEAHAEALTRQLKRVLPNFMQPTRIHWRKSFPLNANGKIDRVALAAEAAA